MRYRIRFATRYVYDGGVPFSQQVLRIAPRANTEQSVIASLIEISPPPAERREGKDFFGNRLTYTAHDTPHDELTVTLEAAVEIRRPSRFGRAITPAWETVRDLALARRDLSSYAPAHFLFASPAVPLFDAAFDYAAPQFEAGRPIAAVALRLTEKIHREFRYKPGVTDTSTTAPQAFESRHGVCQDFAHVMIACLRSFGVPAAYVSGYLRTHPPEGQPRLEGADAMHAWVKVWCGERDGWLGFDPTNGIAVDESHIEIAIGRDYTDVAPVTGIVVASGAHDFDAGVDVEEMS